jgi:hypothetical protein
MAVHYLQPGAAPANPALSPAELHDQRSVQVAAICGDEDGDEYL